MLYKHTTDTAYITESGGKNKQARTWVSPKRKKRGSLSIFPTFYASVSVTSLYAKKIPTQLPGILTHTQALADPASVFTSLNSSFSSRLSLTVANSFPLLSVLTLGPCISSDSSGLVGNLTRKPSEWVSCQSRQRNPLTGTPTPTEMNAHHRATIYVIQS